MGKNQYLATQENGLTQSIGSKEKTSGKNQDAANIYRYGIRKSQT
jgi:hypothetical protein